MTAAIPRAAPARRAARLWRRIAILAAHARSGVAAHVRAGAIAALLAGLLAGPVALGAIGSAAAQQTALPGDGYVADIADLPLMRGLEEVAQAGMAFDKPAGRIVEAYAQGAVDAAAVRRFYRETLPQLGWRRLGPDRFAREDEQLEIDYLGDDGDLTVRYTLQPR